MSRFATFAKVVPSSFVVLALAAPVRIAIAVDCGDWNTEAFFEATTPATVHNCLEEGADPNARTTRVWISGRFLFTTDDFTLLHFATMSANLAVVRVLLDAGADPNVKDENGRTPLHFAAKNNTNPAVISTLLNAGANLEARTKSLGETPLHMAATNNRNSALLTTLLDAGADPLALLHRGADPNAQDHNGWTPLHHAVILGGSATPDVLLPC